MSEQLDLQTIEGRRRWNAYVGRLDRQLRGVGRELRSSVHAELVAHLRDALAAARPGPEDRQLASALERLGPPEQFAAEWLALAAESGALSTRWRLQRLAGQLGRAFLAGIGYLLGAYLALLAVLKPFFPDHIGLFMLRNGLLMPGYVDSDGSRELLGWWLIPATVAGCALCWWLARRLTRPANG